MTRADYLMRILAAAALYLAVVSGSCAWRDDSPIAKVIAGACCAALVGTAWCFWRGGRAEADVVTDADLRRSAERAERGER